MSSTGGGGAIAPEGKAARDSTASMVVPDSVNTALTTAIRNVSAMFDVPDSVLSGMASTRVIDVDSTTNVGNEPTWDIEVNSYATQEKVAHYVDLFLGTARSRFVERLQRGKQYEPMIRERFRTAGIPEDMYYLGLVESGFDPHAYSRAAAVGMWQFMSSTARGVGLRVDWWVDERRDPVKSTDAAARFIRDLRAQFGSLYLAAAAYNGGPGRVSRGLKKFDDELTSVEGEDCFFALAEQDYLRTETKNYVPQLIAAAIIGKTPEKYGIQLDTTARFAYDSVMVPSLTPVAAVARALGVSVREIQALNPHLLRGVTPPDAQMAVRIPVGSGSAFDSAFRSLPNSEREAFTKVVTKKGESLASIARAHDVQVRHLQWFNRNIATRKGRLVVGQTLLVPSPGVVQGAFDVPDPSIERYGSGGGSGGGRATHVVRRGESLGTLAKRYHTSVAALRRLNGLKRAVIYPGQTIIVKGGSARASRSAGVSAKSSKGRAAGKSSAGRRSSGKASAGKSSAGRKSTAKGKAKARSGAKKKTATSRKKAAAR